MKYYVAWVIGFLDMREVSGPHESLREAKIAAANLSIDRDESGFRAPDNSSFEGAWFAVHPLGGMADGPYISSQQAKFERKRNISDPDCFHCDCGEDKGFVAKLVAMFGNVGVLERC